MNYENKGKKAPEKLSSTLIGCGLLGEITQFRKKIKGWACHYKLF